MTGPKMNTMNHSQGVAAILATFDTLTPADADATADHLRGILASLPEKPTSALRSQLEAFLAGYDAGRQASRG